MKKTSFFPLLFSALSFSLLFSSCQETEIGSSKDVNQQAIYFEYDVSADEESGMAVVRLRYRFGGPHGTTLLLAGPSEVSFNGKTLQPDSSKYNGVYYEAAVPVAELAGEQVIRFTDTESKMYENSFQFSPVYIADSLPAMVRQGKDLVIQLGGLSPRDYISFILTDTAFGSREIHRTDTLQDGRLVIFSDELTRLQPGPLSLEIYREERKRLENTTPEGGVLVKTYALRREITLAADSLKAD